MRSIELVSVPCLLVILVAVTAGSIIENSAQRRIFRKTELNHPTLNKDVPEFIAKEAKDELSISTDLKLKESQTIKNSGDGDGEGSNVFQKEAINKKTVLNSDVIAATEKSKLNFEKLDRTDEKSEKPLEAKTNPKQEGDEKETENNEPKEQTAQINQKKDEIKDENESILKLENNVENVSKGTQPSIGTERTEVEKTDIPKADLESNSNSTDKEKVYYNGVKVLRVVIQNKEQKKMIKQMEKKGEISTWLGNGTAVDILIKQEKVLKILKDKNLSYDVIIDDLQKAIEEENPPISQEEMSELEGRKGHKMTWQMYHRMDDIHGYIDYLTATYSDICSQETIGYSVEGRPLKVLKISSGKPNKTAIWVDSGIHAREWITPATSTYIISQMVETGDGTHGVDWYFLPIVNPDGYEHSHTVDRLWRKNRANSHKGQCAGTDLNRNFGYRWGGQGASQQPCRETYAGAGPFSEPETSAINKFVLKHSSEFKGYISLHSYGQYILYPWGYDRKVPPDYSDLHRVGRAMAQAMRHSGGQFYRVGSAAATLYPASGGSDDWAKGIAKIKYVYTIELRDTGKHGFVLPAQYIHPTAKETYAAFKVLAKEVSLL